MWAKLSEGGAPGRCGWLKDKFAAQDPDPEKSNRVMQAMMQMSKIDIAGLQRAHRAA